MILLHDSNKTKEELETLIYTQDVDYLFVTMGAVWWHPLFERIRALDGYGVAEFCRSEMNMLELYEPRESQCTWLAVCRIKK